MFFRVVTWWSWAWVIFFLWVKSRISLWRATARKDRGKWGFKVSLENKGCQNQYWTGVFSVHFLFCLPDQLSLDATAKKIVWDCNSFMCCLLLLSYVKCFKPSGSWWKTRCADIWIIVMIFGLPGVQIIFVVFKNNLSIVRCLVLDTIWLLCSVTYNFSLKIYKKCLFSHWTDCINTAICLKLEFMQKTKKTMKEINERN